MAKLTIQKILMGYGAPIPGVSTTNQYGWCFQNGVLDSTGLQRIVDGLNGGVNTPYVNISRANEYCTKECRTCTKAACATAIANVFAKTMFAGTDYLATCQWPPGNYVPTGCRCTFTCNAGYTACGTNCINPNTQSCVSGVPVTKKARRSMSHMCPEGLSRCPLPRGGYECVDTRTDIESCGGCPRLGEKVENPGVDCTDLPGVSGVRCLEGRCQVDACDRGYVFLDGSCVGNGTYVARRSIFA